MTQNETILAHLKTGQTITPMLAYELYGCLALHSRISELRRAGHTIYCRHMTTDTGKRYGLYRLAEQKAAA